MPTTALGRIVPLLLAGAIGAASAVSASDSERKPAAPTTTCASQPGVAIEAKAGDTGMRIYLDPESGTIGPPTPQSPAVVDHKSAPAPVEQPVQVVLPDGSVMMELKGTCQEYVVMQIDANGRLNTRCVQDPAAAVAHPNPTPQPQDR